MGFGGKFGWSICWLIVCYLFDFWSIFGQFSVALWWNLGRFCFLPIFGYKFRLRLCWNHLEIRFHRHRLGWDWRAPSGRIPHSTGSSSPTIRIIFSASLSVNAASWRDPNANKPKRPPRSTAQSADISSNLDESWYLVIYLFICLYSGREKRQSENWFLILSEISKEMIIQARRRRSKVDLNNQTN